MTSTPANEPSTYPQPASTHSGPTVLWHLLSAAVGLFLTPLALVLLAYGGSRVLRSAQAAPDGDWEAMAILTLLAGGLLLAVVVAAGAMSPLGPVVGGVVWAGTPSVLYLVDPGELFSWLHDIPLLPAEAQGLHNLAATGGMLGISAVLVGAGIASSLQRAFRSR